VGLLVMKSINSLFNSWITKSGASGPSSTLKQFSNKRWHLSSVFLNNSTEAKGPPLVALAQGIPTVT